MNLEQAIHRRWAESTELGGMLGVDRLKTGLVHGVRMPYATLARRPGRTLFRTSAGEAVDEIPLEIHVWHDRFDAGQAIADRVKSAFDRSDFSLSDGGRVVQMRRTGESVVEHDGGVWQWTMRFSVQVHLPSGC